MNQEIKADAGKAQVSLVPMQIVFDIAHIRMFGNMKYKDPNSWRQVEVQRYIDALGRHCLAFLNDPYGKRTAAPMAFRMQCGVFKRDYER